MSSRLVSAALPRRTFTHSATIAAVRHSNSARVGHSQTTCFATPNNNSPELSMQGLSSPKLALAKSLSHQIKPSKPTSSTLALPVGVFARAFEENRKLDESNKAFQFGEHHGKIAHAWEPVEKEMWLERFGGPGKMLDRVLGTGRVVQRDAAPDGKGYLRVLI